MKIELMGNKLTLTFDVDEMKIVNYITTKHGLNWFSRLFSLEFKRRERQADFELINKIKDKFKKDPNLAKEVLG